MTRIKRFHKNGTMGSVNVGFGRSVIAFLICLFMAGGALADFHLEAGGYLTTTTVLDDSFEFFTHDYMVLDHYGADIRVEVAEIAKKIHLLPYVSYRYSNSNGYPVISDTSMDTSLTMHDLDAGLRGRMWFLSWLGAYAQVYTGISRIQMQGELNQNGQKGMLNRYEDNATKWNVGAGLGAEFRIAPRHMKRAGVKWLNLGGEIGVGFIKRMQTDFAPSLKGGDELSLSRVNTANFGSLDLSGVVFQMGLTLSFL